MRIARELGNVPEKSLILNNLGILHIQENRFREAIRCYRQAEKLALELAEHQVLVNIQSNLAVLYAKIGECEAAEQSLLRATDHDARCDSRRTTFQRLHASGLVELFLGQYASAIETFRASVELGRELKDSFLVAFDLVYVGECHLFRGEWKPQGRLLKLQGGLAHRPRRPLLRWYSHGQRQWRPCPGLHVRRGSVRFVQEGSWQWVVLFGSVERCVRRLDVSTSRDAGGSLSGTRQRSRLLPES